MLLKLYTRKLISILHRKNNIPTILYICKKYKKGIDMIVVVGGIKGGSGKTTIATNLVVMRSANEKKVLFVDADEQHSATDWLHQREEEDIETKWTTIQLSGKSIYNQILKLKKDYHDIIIDVGGRDTTSQRSCLMVADVFIIPFQPRSLDIWTIGNLTEMIDEVTSLNISLKSYALINKADQSGTDNREAKSILNNYEEFSCLPFMIGQRKAFANAATNGMGITEMKIKDSKAILEINELYDFIYRNDI